MTLDIGICMWYATHRLVMMHKSMKFHEILFVVWTSKRTYLTSISDLRGRTNMYNWYATHNLVISDDACVYEV